MIQAFPNPEDALPGSSEMNVVAFARICKALGHPARVRILEHLRSTDRCICGEIVDILPLAQSTVSQHLKCLKNAGLIQGNVEGPRTCYCLNRDALERFRQMADKLSL
jgi:DNA-binding transcriptional ArsR family regulator